MMAQCVGFKLAEYSAGTKDGVRLHSHLGFLGGSMCGKWGGEVENKARGLVIWVKLSSTFLLN